jgi:isoquinoline 1-oxidoreductase subunit beta
MASENNETKQGFSRRKFLKRGAIVLGGSVVASYIGCSPMRRFVAQKVENMEFPVSLSSLKPDFWFEVLADNSILLKSPKSEMGQGIFTGFAMMAAEELGVALSQIKVVPSNTLTGSIDALGTGGSNSTSSMFKPIREVAATMREMLKLAAAKQWGVNAADIKVENGVMSAAGKTMTYADISKSTKEWTVPKTPTLKPESEFKFIGKDVKRVDLKDKVLGKPIFGIDQSFPNMLYAVALQSPYIGGTIKSINVKNAENTEGVVKVIQDKDLVAIVAKNRYTAELALGKIEAEWDVPKKWQQADLEQIMTVGNGKEVNVQNVGSAESILKNNAVKVIKQEYRTPIGVHAQMEATGAVAHVEADKATIFAGIQAVQSALDAVAKATGLKKDQINIKTTFLGGGFGRKYAFDQCVKAARISKIVGKPVSLFNTREQEFLNSTYYRPNTHHVLQATLNADGSIEAISHEQATPDMMIETMAGPTALKLLGADFISAGHGASVLYSVKNKTTSLWHNKLPIPTGIWRSVGIFSNTFAVESFVNELAHKAGKDPIAFRLGMVSGSAEINERYKKVLEALAEKSGWNTPKVAGVGRGVAMTNDRQTIAAAAIEITMVDNEIKVKKVTSVVDAGFAVNPEGIRQQVEGCIMMGISASLYEGVQVKDGQMTASTFAEYPLSTLADVPEIQVVILQNTKELYGIGEPPIGPIAPAIAAAIFDLTGKNLRSLPLKLA